MDDKRLERIEQKIDDTNDHLASIDVTLGMQHISLKEHVRRSNLLEAKMVPIEKHIAMVNGALKLLGILAMIAGIYEVFKR